MTTFVDYTNFPAGPLSDGQGINLIRSGAPDQKYIWQNGTGPGAWIAVDVDGNTIATPRPYSITEPYEYDSTEDGGTGDVTMRGRPLPLGSVVTTVTTLPVAPLSGTGAIGLTLESAGDMSASQDAATITGAVPTVSVGLSGTALYFGGAGVSPGTGSTAVLTDDRAPVVNITGEIAGSFITYVTAMVR